MPDVTEHFRGSGFKVFAGMIEKDPKVRVWAIPAPNGGIARLLRPHERLGAEGRPAGPRLHHSGAKDRGRSTPAPVPIAKNIGAGRATEADLQKQNWASKSRRRLLLRRRRPGQILQVRRPRPRRDRPRAEARSTRTASPSPGSSTSRSTSGTRRRRRSTSRTTRSRCRRAAARRWKPPRRPAATRSWRSRPTSTTSSATATRSPRARSATTCPRPWSRPSRSPGSAAQDVEARFGGLYRAFQYGAPPHGGMAAGIERMVMLLTGCKTVRDVALFPMNQQANDLLMGAPSEVTPEAAARTAYPAGGAGDAQVRTRCRRGSTPYCVTPHNPPPHPSLGGLRATWAARLLSGNRVAQTQVGS